MPVPDPIPSPRHSVMRRFWRIFRLLALLSVVIAAIAVFLVMRGDPTPLSDVHVLIATALGAGLTVLVGTALMTLVFISNSSGHDSAAADFQQENDKE
jgi:NAD/NADP transhydrogenase beta subunit